MWPQYPQLVDTLVDTKMLKCVHMRTEIIKIRVSPDEKATIQDMSHGDVSGFVRERIFSNPTAELGIEMSEEWKMLIKALPENFLDMLAQRAQSREDVVRWAGVLVAFLRGSVATGPNDAGAGVSPVNPYAGWWVEPAPDGSVKGYLDENTNKYMKVITDGKKYVKLFEDNPLYNQF